MTDSTPTERALRILAILQSGRCVRADDLAARLGVDARTIRRDIARLRGLGYDVSAQGGPAGGYRLAASDRLPPLQLAPSQAESIAVGLQIVGAQGVEPLASAARETLDVLTRLLPPASAATASRVAAGLAVVPDEAMPQLDAAVIVELAGAVTERRHVRFAYIARSGEASERRVEPARVVRFGRRWYLLGFDSDRDDWRTFRLDRMDALHVTTLTFPVRPAPDAIEHVRSSVRAASAPRLARLRVRAPEAVVREKIPASVGDIIVLGGGECEVAIGIDDATWAALFVASRDLEIVAASPRDVAAALHALGEGLRKVEARE